LPDGAKFSSIYIYYNDTDTRPDGVPIGGLFLVNLSTGGRQEIGLFSFQSPNGPNFSGGDTYLQWLDIAFGGSIANHTVDNNAYAYFVMFTAWENAPGIKINGIKLQYTVTAVD